MIILGLGSNIGDKLLNLKNAVAALRAILQDIKTSSVYESPALLPEGAPPEWNQNFYNMAIGGNTKLTPQEFLMRIKNLEEKLGRKKTGRWGPREIDIDILAYNNVVVNGPDLTIPHQHLLARDFALVPLAEIAPDWLYPKAGESYGMNAETLAGKISKKLTKLNAW